ncbi:MAG: tRNA (adenosine(37)-N6)-threonylcarbamoyltransferase complex dimerization subunit type 1 TsaB [Candidatus Omnitrophica bacterium]|nr:tRNA (adenosine(37)-N6)-threonylcarbamoyltransferase complex dimerization subunit type 1 TsaB [Candidatus Omnitrophota bacterium]
MNILAIETSSKNFSVAVSQEGRVVRFRNIVLDKVLESSIIPGIDAILKKAKIKLSEIDGFAVGLGPGSFTSLRVGVATIKAMALSTGKPVVGIPTLDVIAQNVAQESCDEICVLTDARRAMVYCGLYEKKNGQISRQSDLMLTTIQDVLKKVHGQTLYVGSAVAIYRSSIEEAYQKFSKDNPSCRALFSTEKHSIAQAAKLSDLAYARFCKKVYDESGALVPVYLYAQDCQVQPQAQTK